MKLSIHLLWIPRPAADLAAVNHNGIKMLQVNSLSALFINCKSTLINGSRVLLRNPLTCNIIDIYVFDYSILADELFAKTLQNIEAYLSVSNKLCEKLVSSFPSPIIFDARFRVTTITLFIGDFNLLSWELDNFTFTLLH